MNRFSTALRLSLIGAAGAALFGGLAAPAQAATTTTVEKSGNTVLVTGTSTANSVTVSNGIGFIRVNDISNVQPLAPCLQDGPHQVKCPSSGISQIRVSALGGNDRVLDSSGFFITVLGGTGDDTLQNVGSGQARLNGNDGNDRLFGASVDSLFGQNGNDFLQGGLFLRGPGNDILRGLDGNDSMFGDEGFDNLDGGPGFDDLCATAEITVNCEAF